MKIVETAAFLFLLLLSHSLHSQNGVASEPQQKPSRRDSANQQPLPKRVWTDEELAAARAKAKRNSIILHLIVDEGGRVISSKVVQGLGNPFDDWARQASSAWRFRHAEKDGRPVMVKVQIEVDPDKAPKS